ncbi:MAG TPA: pilus assembly protein TadG-related protein [Nocardioides sp.]|nr:pilus assembly protein TadG-related protein [Nocardioides sp.]
MRAQRGSITPFVVIVAFAVLLLAGLVVDGGAQMNAHGRAIAYAQEAARAGAQGLDLQDPRLDLDFDLAEKLANTYCADAKAEDAELVSCDARVIEVADKTSTHKAVEVRTAVRVPTIMLTMVGVGSLSASGTALASPMPGITGPNGDIVPTAPPPTLDVPSGGATPPTAGGGTVTIGCPTVTLSPKHPHTKGTKGPKPPKPSTTVSCPTHG